MMIMIRPSHFNTRVSIDMIRDKALLAGVLVLQKDELRFHSSILESKLAYKEIVELWILLNLFGRPMTAKPKELKR